MQERRSQAEQIATCETLSVSFLNTSTCCPHFVRTRTEKRFWRKCKTDPVPEKVSYQNPEHSYGLVGKSLE